MSYNAECWVLMADLLEQNSTPDPAFVSLCQVISVCTMTFNFTPDTVLRDYR